ncbi:hypothetical protein DFS34DRAFT_621305 [Phlyctochytrium arcticum]|nr:hypothetical protein DFS34DRAFT_621305 [Phlyctochytrium arcticum]
MALSDTRDPLCTALITFRDTVSPSEWRIVNTVDFFIQKKVEYQSPEKVQDFLSTVFNTKEEPLLSAPKKNKVKAASFRKATGIRLNAEVLDEEMTRWKNHDTCTKLKKSNEAAAKILEEQLEATELQASLQLLNENNNFESYGPTKLMVKNRQMRSDSNASAPKSTSPVSTEKCPRASELPACTFDPFVDEDEHIVLTKRRKLNFPNLATPEKPCHSA